MERKNQLEIILKTDKNVAFNNENMKPQMRNDTLKVMENENKIEK